MKEIQRYGRYYYKACGEGGGGREGMSEGRERDIEKCSATNKQRLVRLYRLLVRGKYFDCLDSNSRGEVGKGRTWIQKRGRFF